MKNPSFIIITHGNSELGMGHLSRSQAIATYLNKKGKSGIYVVKDSPECHEFFQDLKNVIFYSEREERNELLSRLDKNNLIIFDCNNTTKEEILFFQSKGCKTVSIDDLGEGRGYSNLLIDANIDTDLKQINQLFGEPFICLSDDYQGLSAKKSIPKRTTKVFISIGGYDVNKFSLKVFRGLFYAFYYSHFESFEIHLKLPASGGDIETILKEAEYYHELEIERRENRYTISIDDAKDLIVHTYKFVPDMHQMILESDILFTSGGLTAYEGLTAGTYTLAFPQNPSEKKVVDRLLRKGFLHAEIDTYRLQEDLEYIFELSEVEFESFLIKSRDSFDGLGTQRVGDALLELMNQGND